MSKCENCRIWAEMKKCEDLCACAWYVDNVLFGDKTIDECTAFEEVKEK